MSFLGTAKSVVSCGCFAVVLSYSGVSRAYDSLELTNKRRQELDLKREQLTTLISKKQCPDGEVSPKTSPEFKSVCDITCQGLPEAAVQACADAFFECEKSYTLMLDTIKLYNTFLTSTCTSAAKDRAAERSAAAAKARDKELEEIRTKKDLH